MAKHMSTPFPESVEKGLNYGEVDAVMIGADIYGWAVRAKSGSLTTIDRDRLHLARDELARSLDAFPEQARPYYEQLVSLASAALS